VLFQGQEVKGEGHNISQNLDKKCTITDFNGWSLAMCVVTVNLCQVC